MTTKTAHKTIDEPARTPLKELVLEPMPLTGKMKSDVKAVKEAYGTFWDNIKFRKGWEKPLFTKDEVAPLLDEAAEVVVRIRSKLDEINPGFKLRMLEGSAKEFLWQFTKDPNKHRSSFVRGLVHATLSDANGYVEGLTREIIDNALDACREYHGTANNVQDSDLIDVVRSKLLSLNELGANFFAKDNDSLAGNYDVVVGLRRLLGQIEEARETLHHLGSLRDSLIEQKKLKGPEVIEEKPALQPPSPLVQDADDEAMKANDDENNEMDVDSSEPESSGSDLDMNPLPTLRSSNSVLLKINKIENDVDLLKKDIIQLGHDIDALDVAALKNDPTSGLKSVEALNKKALIYSEELMKELLSLDEVVVSQEQRPRRKAQVNAINALLEVVDSIRNRLKPVKEELQAAVKEEKARKAQEEAEAKAKKEKEEADARARAQLEAERRKAELESQKRKSPQVEEYSDEDEEEDGEEDKMEAAPLEEEGQRGKEESIWRRLKFEPEFDVQETRDSYIIKAFVPGMSPGDISVDLENGRDLVLEGYREPSPEEVAIMKKKIAAIRRQDPRGLHIPRGETEQSLLLRLGAGKFGKFRQAYQIPADANVDGIRATYERGLLVVIIPKIVRRTAYAPQPRPHQTQRMADPRAYGFPGFFNDGGFFW